MKRIKKFGNKKLKIRFLEKSDIKRAALFKKYINELVDDDTALISKKTKVTLKEEKEWLRTRLKEIKEKKRVILVAEDNGKVVGLIEIALRKPSTQNHIANLFISVLKDYRSVGLGTYLMKEVLKLAKKKLKPKPKILTLEAFAVNKIALSLYKKMGCRQVAKIPKQFKLKGKFYDEVIMLKYL